MVHIPSEQEFGDFADWRGRPVLGRDGATIGRVEEIFLDTETRKPEWVLVVLEGDGGLRLAPLADAQVRGDTLTVAYGDQQIRSAPAAQAGEPVAQDQERDLYAHYGLSYSHAGSGTGLASDAAGEDAAETGATAQDPPAAVRVAPEDAGAADGAGGLTGAPAGGPADVAGTGTTGAPAGGETTTSTAGREAAPPVDLDRDHAREDLAEAPAAAPTPEAEPAVDFAFPSVTEDARPAYTARVRDPKILAAAGAAVLVLVVLALRRLRS